MTRVVALVLLLGILTAGKAFCQPALLVGVLEDDVQDAIDHPHQFAIRAAFQKTADGWSALPSDCPDQRCLARAPAQYPQRVDWAITFDGRVLGKLSAVTPKTWGFYGDIGKQFLTRSDTIPKIGAPSLAFAGWMGEPVQRPLVALTRPNAADPDQWKRAPLNQRTTAALRAAFRRRFPVVENCRNGQENPRLWKYRENDIHVSGGYASRGGWHFASLLLEPNRCDNPSDGALDSQSFVISPDGKVAFLGEGLALVDAGDYDLDGHSELIFAISRYDLGGYVLAYDDFRKRAEFRFGYH